MFVVTLPAHADAASFAVRAAAAGADLLELRGDISPDQAPFASPLPLLLAPRGGDLRRLVQSDRAPIFALDLEEGEAFVDELPESCLRVMSRHDHAGLPPLDEMMAFVARARAAGADVVKLAVTPREPADLLVLDRLRRTLARDGRVVVTAMGPLARIDRLLGASVNAWTYACLEPGLASAAGQLPLAEHQGLGGAEPPRLFGVLGGPDLRSFSPEIHNRLFADHGHRAAYAAFPTADLAASFRALSELGVEGFSITSPYKNAMVELMDDLDPLAARLRSVNTARRVDGRWKGWQTDVVGIEESQAELRGCGRVVVVGSGGVVPAVLEALRRLEVEQVAVMARNVGAARALADRFGVESGSLEALSTQEVDALIWTLPLDLPALALPEPRPGARALDLRYGNTTDFMRRAAGLGYAVSDGLSMLVAQALAQFEIFSGEPRSADDRELLLAMLRE